MLYDAGCAEQELAVSHHRGSPIRFERQGTPVAWCGTAEYARLDRQIVGALEGASITGSLPGKHLTWLGPERFE